MQGKESLRKWRRSSTTKIQLSEGDNGGDDEVIQIDTTEIIEK